MPPARRWWSGRADTKIVEVLRCACGLRRQPGAETVRKMKARRTSAQRRCLGPADVGMRLARCGWGVAFAVPVDAGVLCKKIWCSSTRCCASS